MAAVPHMTTQVEKVLGQKEILMTRRNVAILALILGGIAAIFFVSNSFDILPSNVAIFLGVVFVIFAGIVWAIRGWLEAKE